MPDVRSINAYIMRVVHAHMVLHRLSIILMLLCDIAEKHATCAKLNDSHTVGVCHVSMIRMSSLWYGEATAIESRYSEMYSMYAGRAHAYFNTYGDYLYAYLIARAAHTSILS
jgi:hypothetical protein